MERANPKSGTVLLVETPEETARAIASALEFLREEAAAVGMRDVSVLIGLARARTQDYCPLDAVSGATNCRSKG